MAAAKNAKKHVWKLWPGRKGSEAALFKPRSEKAWCSFATAMWLIERVNIALAIPGTFAGDVRNGGKLVASWEGLPMWEMDLKPGVLLAERDGKTFHVRLEDGEGHEGHPDQCDEGICLAERVMFE